MAEQHSIRKQSVVSNKCMSKLPLTFTSCPGGSMRYFVRGGVACLDRRLDRSVRRRPAAVCRRAQRAKPREQPLADIPREFGFLFHSPEQHDREVAKPPTYLAMRKISGRVFRMTAFHSKAAQRLRRCLPNHHDDPLSGNRLRHLHAAPCRTALPSRRWRTAWTSRTPHGGSSKQQPHRVSSAPAARAAPARNEVRASSGSRVLVRIDNSDRRPSVAALP